MQRGKDWNGVLQEAHDTYTTQIDAADPNNVYIGRAKMGFATSDSQWQIKKIITNGGVTTIAYANGEDNYDKIWDNRAALPYS